MRKETPSEFTKGFPGLNRCKAAPIQGTNQMALCQMTKNSGCPHELMLKDLKLCRHPDFKLIIQRTQTKAAPAKEMQRIMLVDDDPGLLETVGAVLRNAGYEVMEAADGERALQVLQEWHYLHVDLVIADMHMPGISGLVLGEKLVVTRPKTKVLLISGYPKSDFALKEGTPWLSKPFTSVALLKEVVSLIGKPTL